MVKSQEGMIKSQAGLIHNQVDEIKGLQREIRECVKWANRNEQYSRRNCVRIKQLKHDEGESSKLAVSKLLNSRLGMKIDESAIIVAHPVRPRKQSNRSNKSLPPVIVRFKNRDIKDEVISRRRQLKGSPQVITEDLTALNNKLLNRVWNHENISKCWASHGKIFGISTSGRKIRFEPFDNNDQKIINADAPHGMAEDQHVSDHEDPVSDQEETS